MEKNCSNREEKEKIPNKYIKALHCPKRWKIIDIIGEDKVSTKKIKEEMKNLDVELSSSNLYYHLSELKKAGIIDVAEYREEGGGAPEKIWKLAKKRIEINLIREE